MPAEMTSSMTDDLGSVGSDVASAVDDAFADSDAGGDAGGGDEETPEVSDGGDDLLEFEPEEEETLSEDTTSDDDQQADEKAEGETAEEKKPQQDEELPEGVRIKERDGKQFYELPANRYKTVYGMYKAAREVESVLGQPLTKELAQNLRADSVEYQELLSNFITPETGPAAVAEQFRKFGSEAKQQLGYDPSVALGEKLVEHVLNSDPAAAERIRTPIIRKTLDDILAKGKLAARQSDGKDKNLIHAVWYIEQALYGKMTPEDAIRVPDEVDARVQRAEQAEQELRQERSRIAEEQFNGWYQGAKAEVGKALDGAVNKALEPYVALGAKLTGDPKKVFDAKLNELRSKLRTDIVSQIGKDAAWVKLRSIDVNRARTSPQERKAIAQQIVTQYQNRAQFLLDPERNTSVRDALAEAAKGQKQANAQKHRQLEQSAQRREPGAIGNQAKRTIAPPKTAGRSAREQYAAAIDAALG